MTRLASTLVRRARTSTALWIPIIWLFIAGSRPVSLWLHLQVIGNAADAQLEGSPVDRNIFTFLVVAAIAVLIARRRKLMTLLVANWPLLLFLVYCGFSIFWSDFPDVAFKRWIRAVGDVSMVLVVLTDPLPGAAVEQFLSRVGYFILPLSILSDLGRGAYGREYRFGLTTNKNMFGAISMVLGLTALWRFLVILRSAHRKGGRRRARMQLLLFGVLIGMALVCIWGANSATSAACFLLGTLVLIATHRWSLFRRPTVLHVMVVSVVFLAIYATIINPNFGIVSTLGKDPTLTGRTDVWQAVIRLNPSRWVGAGFESFWLGDRLKEMWSIFVWQPNEAHDGYIEMYLNLGWIGLALFGLVMIVGYSRIVRGVRDDRDFGSLRLAFFVVAVVYNLTEAGFRIFNPVYIVFLLSLMMPRRLYHEKITPRPAVVASSVDSPVVLA